VEGLKKKGIGSEVYYINPVHQMPFYRENFGSAKLSETERASKQVFSLPIHPGVTEKQVRFIGETVLSLL
jgi:perosamine synthetase